MRSDVSDEMIAMAEAEGPLVYRIGGSQIYHRDPDCPSFRNKNRSKRPRTFQEPLAQALKWKPCQQCSRD